MGKLTQEDVLTIGLGFHPDGGGLYLQVSSLTARSWIYRCKVGYPGLGSAYEVSLEEARRKRDELRTKIRSGANPLEEKRAVDRAKKIEGSALSLQAACERFIAEQRRGGKAWSNKKHAAQWSSTLRTYVYPIIGRKLVKDISRADVIEVLDPIWLKIPETARRVRGRIEAILDWAVAHDLRPDGANPASRQGPLLKGLPKQPRAVKHHPALAYDDVPGFMGALRTREGIAGAAFEFTILTAARTNETIGAKWSEIELDKVRVTTRDRDGKPATVMGPVWIVPAERMKADRAHRVPLSSAAVALLKHLKASAGDNDLLFPNPEDGGPLSNMAMLKVLERMDRSDITVHGFRSTFRDWAAEQTDYPRELAEAALAHSLKDETERAYQRGDLFEKRRKLMEAWAVYCTPAPAIGGNVVPMRSASVTG